MLVHRRATPRTKFAGTHLYTWVERGTVRVKCLAQEHNTMSPTRARTRSARSGVKRANHGAIAPPTFFFLIALILLKSLLLLSGSHTVSCFSARAEIPFRLLEIFSARGAIQPRVKIIIKILARFDQSGLGFSAGAELHPRAESLSM